MIIITANCREFTWNESEFLYSAEAWKSFIILGPDFFTEFFEFQHVSLSEASCVIAVDKQCWTWSECIFGAVWSGLHCLIRHICENIMVNHCEWPQKLICKTDRLFGEIVFQTSSEVYTVSRLCPLMKVLAGCRIDQGWQILPCTETFGCVLSSERC